MATIPRAEVDLLPAFKTGVKPGGVAFPDAWEEFIRTAFYKFKAVQSAIKAIPSAPLIQPAAVLQIDVTRTHYDGGGGGGPGPTATTRIAAGCSVGPMVSLATDFSLFQMDITLTNRLQSASSITFFPMMLRDSTFRVAAHVLNVSSAAFTLRLNAQSDYTFNTLIFGQ